MHGQQGTMLLALLCIQCKQRLIVFAHRRVDSSFILTWAAVARQVLGQRNAALPHDACRAGASTWHATPAGAADRCACRAESTAEAPKPGMHAVACLRRYPHLLRQRRTRQHANTPGQLVIAVQ